MQFYEDVKLEVTAALRTLRKTSLRQNRSRGKKMCPSGHLPTMLWEIINVPGYLSQLYLDTDTCDQKHPGISHVTE